MQRLDMADGNADPVGLAGFLDMHGGKPACAELGDVHRLFGLLGDVADDRHRGLQQRKMRFANPRQPQQPGAELVAPRHRVLIDTRVRERASTRVRVYQTR